MLPQLRRLPLQSGLRRHFSSLPAKRIRIIYGTFDCGNSGADAEIMQEYV